MPKGQAGGPKFDGRSDKLEWRNKRLTAPRVGEALRFSVFFLLLAGCARSNPELPSGPADNASSPSPIPPSPTEAIQFEDVTPKSGIHFSYRNGDEAGELTLLETLGGGVGLIDYDRDGWLDLFLTGGGNLADRRVRGLPGRLYRNLGSCRFEDVTDKVGLDGASLYSHGVAVTDYDGDGWPDLLMTGYGGVRLYRNSKGRFVDVTSSAGLKQGGWPTSAAWGDLNGDGRPDLYLTHYVNWSFENHPRCPGYISEHPFGVCSPRVFTGLSDVVYLNNGDGTFRDATHELGLRPGGKGLGVIIADLDDDGRPDVYVANDTTENFLYLNRPDRPFEEVGLTRGVAFNGHGTAQGSMGVDVSDAEGNGNFSIFVTNFQNEPHAFYRALGGGRFHFSSEAVGVTTIGFTFVGFGVGFADFDNDGHEDLFLANGHISQHPAPPSEYRQRPIVFRHVGGDRSIRYVDVSHLAGSYFQEKRVGRGVALGDLDNDGRMDVVISHINDPATILKNVSNRNHHWLGLILIGEDRRDIVGAKVTLEANGRSQSRQVKGGSSYLSSSDRRILFGLGPDEGPVRITVRWPYGSKQTWENIKVDHYWTLKEGETVAEPTLKPQLDRR